LVPATSAVVVQVATLELSVLAEQPDKEVPPSSKFTVPVAPVVTVAVKVIEVLGFWGDDGDAVNVVVEDVPPPPDAVAVNNAAASVYSPVGDCEAVGVTEVETPGL
jgi:hypothetical protein